MVFRKPFAQTFVDNAPWEISTSQLHVERRFSVSFGTPSWARHRPEECRATFSALFRTGRFLVPPPVSRSIFFGLRSSSFFFSVLGLLPEVLGRADLNFGSAPGLFTGVEGEWQWRWPGCTWVSAAFLFRPSSRMLYSVGPLSALPVKRSPAKRSCQPQPRESRREAAPRKDTRQDCRSYVTWRSGSLFNFCTGVV